MFSFPSSRTILGVEPIPDLTGWRAYCDGCRKFREVRRAQEWDVSTHEEYFDFVCNDVPPHRDGDSTGKSGGELV